MPAELTSVHAAASAARLIDGTALAARIRAELADEVSALRARGVTPGLTVVLVGDDVAVGVARGDR